MLTAVFPRANYLRREHPAMLISAPDHANLPAIWAKMLAGVDTAVIITTHNYLSIVTREVPKLQEKIYPLLLRLFKGFAAKVVAVSEGVADDLARIAKIPREQISVIYNPVIHSALEELASQTPDYPWAANDVPYILAVGRLGPQKDYPTLLKAFSLLKEKRPLRLLILGEGEERHRLADMVNTLGLSSQVFLPGYVKNPYAFMANCRVFALSSAWEGFSLVIAEALYCGAQVVSTNCPSGPAEILENGRYGRLVPVGNVSALSEAMEEALEHPLPVKDLKSRAMDFSDKVAVKKYLSLIGLA
jgi:glycosyltransferase involved in cell wall biosynthesis